MMSISSADVKYLFVRRMFAIEEAFLSQIATKLEAPLVRGQSFLEAIYFILPSINSELQSTKIPMIG